MAEGLGSVSRVSGSMKGIRHIETLTFPTGRDYCDGEREGLGGDGVAIQHRTRYLAIARKDAA